MPGPPTLVDRPKEVRAEGVPSVQGLSLIRLLARGGFAEVWEAEQVSLARRVAVKILRHEHLAHRQMVDLFDQEARVLARLSHPNVVQVIDRGTCSHGPYIVMEYVEGETLQEILSRGGISQDRALTILMQSARGLAYAHRNRIIHRDVKPANILVGRNGHVKMSDFGIAAVRAAAVEEPSDDSEPRRTALGTRAFMAPEQRVSFDGVGPAADVYSLGVILHRIVTGRLPQPDAALSASAQIPDALLAILEKSLSFDPEARYADAGAFREALVNALAGQHLDDRVRRGAATAFASHGRFELLDVIRQDDRRSVYLVRRGGPHGDKIVVKRYLKNAEALRTARTMMRVQHPHIVRLYAVAEREDSFIMVMEHLPGGDLRERLVQPHPWQEAARIGRDVARALAHAARHGVVHGNVRPSNIMFDRAGAIRVTDFGLPEHYVGEAGKRNWYAPPEGGRSAEADLYALGAVLYEVMFAAGVPENPAAALEKAGQRGDIPDGMLAVLRRLMAEPGLRYDSAELVAQHLESLLRDDEISASAERARSAATTAVARCGAVAAVRAQLAALIGLGGLLLVWALQLPAVQQRLVDWFASH
ncbi:MAG: protein kinase [Acidobacteria bacterium]|nr:protein kinase [Acidobacteriota bacterium]